MTNSFTELGLIEPFSKILHQLGYTEPTPIQSKAIPHLLNGMDLFGCAQTGTGKTAAFALPVIQNIYLKKNDGPKKIRAVILAPTRELATQIGDSFRDYGRSLGIKYHVIFGGVSQHTQVQAVRAGLDVLVATPGRLLDLMNQGLVRLDQVEFFVLDEADRMLDMGFINDIKKISSKLPSKRQTILLSATVPTEIKQLSSTLLKDPVFVETAVVSSASEQVSQSLYYVEKAKREDLLRFVIDKYDMDQVLVFTRTKHGADKLTKGLVKHGLKAEAIHGNKSQNARERALEGFKKKRLRILVATDVASRGIDITKLSHVVNYELPDQAETYVHRIGRTGRAGETGTALSFCTSEEVDKLRDIKKLLKKEIDIDNDHPFLPLSSFSVAKSATNSSAKRGNFGNRRRAFFTPTKKNNY